MSSLKLSVFVITILIFSFFKTYSQSSFSSEKGKTPTNPVFKDGVPGLISHFRREIIPIISSETKDAANFPTSLRMTLTIYNNGKVIHVHFVNTIMEENSKRAVTSKILGMRG